MRGSPFLQAVFIVAVFVLAGVPVYRLTRPAAVAAAVISTTAGPVVDLPPAETAPLDVAAVFAPAPTDFEIKNLDQTVLAGHGPQARFTTRWTTSVPPEGVDLVVLAHWPVATGGVSPEAGPAAARVTIRFPDGHQVEHSVWAAANGTASEVFTVPGASPSPAAP